MAFRQKLLFVSNEGKCGYSEDLVQDRFLSAILERVRNNNIRHKLRRLLKNSILTGEEILENLLQQMSVSIQISLKKNK